MKNGLLIFFLICSMVAFTQNDLKIQIREHFYLASQSEQSYNRFVKLSEKHKQKQFVYPYIAMTYFMKAKYVLNPYSKLSAFKKGKNELEKIIREYPKAIEPIFLRLVIQTELPSLLGYKSNIQKDVAFLKKYVDNLKDHDLKTRITEFLKLKYA